MREWEELILSHIKNMLFYLVFLNVNIYIFNTTIVMIDDKKIEEAAQGAADLYEQDLPIMSYNEDTEVDGQHHFCQEFGAELFKDGAKWAIYEFLKNLWHPDNEKPKRRYNYLLLHYKDKEEECFEADVVDTKAWDCYIKGSLVEYINIDDLFPKEGGEQ